LPLPSPLDTGEEPAVFPPSRGGASASGARLIRLTADGLESDEYPLRENGAVTIGREGCDVSFPGDTSLSPRHASIVHDGEGYSLRDEGSASGVFLRLASTEKLEIEPGDLLSAGRQFLLLEGERGRFQLLHYDATGRKIGGYALPERTVVLGRQAPDVTLDAADRTLSRRQIAVTLADGRVRVKDLKSANGTYLRLRGARSLAHGTRLRVGRQRFVFSARADAVLDAADSARSPPPPAAPAVAADATVTVTFLPSGKTCPVRPGQTLCEVAEAHGVALSAECHAGICGSDPLRVVAGQENLTAPATRQESETLEEICELVPGEHRLACQARIRGPVTVEVL
jgi:ferredoxin